jgi:hypothetical protein
MQLCSQLAPAPVAPETFSAPKPRRSRTVEARRKARQAKAERERAIVDCLTRGVSVAELALKAGVTHRRMRAIVQEILSRRLPAPPAEYVALQIARLNEALIVAFGAMSNGNLQAVDRVVSIVAELDRYHGFSGAVSPAAGEPRALADASPRPLSLAAPTNLGRLAAPRRY